MNNLSIFDRFKIERHGTVLLPQGEEESAVMNPTTYLDRDGRLVAIYRAVNKKGRSSSLRLATWNAQTKQFDRAGIALSPTAEYEKNGRDGGEGCEDARVVFVKELDLYMMAYTAYGPAGPRQAIAFSKDGYTWERLGLVRFPDRQDLNSSDNKNGCFLPEMVLSPSNIWSFAFLHRPRVPIAPDGVHDVEKILEDTPDDRPGIWVAYVPAGLVNNDLKSLLEVRETLQIITPDMIPWKTAEQMQIGGGTQFVPVTGGASLLTLYHGVHVDVAKGILPDTKRYDISHWGGAAVVDAKRPHKVQFVGSIPMLQPETPEELGDGRYRNIAFPTALVVIDARSVDMFYGASDTFIQRATVTFEEDVF